MAEWNKTYGLQTLPFQTATLNCITQTFNIPGQLEWWDCSRIEFCPGVTVEWNKFLTGDIYRCCVLEFARNPLSRVAALGMLRLFFEQVFLWRLEGRVSPDVGPHLEAESCRHCRFGRTHDGRHFVFRKHGVSEMTERNTYIWAACYGWSFISLVPPKLGSMPWLSRYLRQTANGDFR